MDSSITARQHIIKIINSLPDDFINELASFIDYLHYKSTQKPKEKSGEKSGASFLLSIAGIGSSAENDVSEHIEITPGVCGGKPRIAGHRIKVAAIAEMYLEMGESLEEIASKYNLSLASVHAAMAYYYDHKQEIDRQTAEGEAFVEELKRNSPPSRLQEKLKELRGE